MMKYESLNYNFIPREEEIEENNTTTDSLEIKTVEEKNQTLMDNNIELLATIEKNEDDIQLLENQLAAKIERSKDQLNATETIIEKDITDKINKMNDYKNQIHVLNNKIHELENENTTLRDELQSHQQYVQMLYLLLLIIVIL